MNDLDSLARAYIDAWNATDTVERTARIGTVFAADVSYRDPVMQGEGHAGIADLIGGVQNQFPGFRFALRGRPDGFADMIRFSWALGPEDSPSVIEGTDVCRIENGLLAQVTGFLDKIPAQ